MKVTKNIQMSIVRLIAVAIIGIVVLISTGISGVWNLKATNGGLNINEMQESEFKKGTYIKGDINFCFGQFAEEDTSDTISKEYYYILPLTQFGYDFDDLKYIAVACSDKTDIEEIDRLTDDTFNYMDDENASEPKPIENYQGKLTYMEDDLKDLMIEYFQDTELYKDDEEISSHILPYTIYQSTATDAYIELGIGVGLVIIFVGIILFIIIRRIKIKKRNEQNQYIGPEIR